MSLQPNMLLSALDYEHPFRLGHLFKRYDGMTVGISSIWPFLDKKKGKPVRPWNNELAIGNFASPFWMEDFLYYEEDENESDVTSPGVLTGCFELKLDVKIPSSFVADRSRPISYAKVMGDVATIDGKAIGQIAHFTDDLPLRTEGLVFRAFPLLRLERSGSDLEIHAIRNGAMVRTRDNRPIGFVVNMFNKSNSYSIAPIEEVMSFHALEFLSAKDIEVWNENRVHLHSKPADDERYQTGASVDKMHPASQQVRAMAEA